MSNRFQSKKDMNEKNQKLKEKKIKKGPRKTDEKTRAMQFGEEGLAEQRIAELTGSNKPADLKEGKFLQDVLDEKKPLSAEARVLKRFMTFFEKEPGICLHGFKPQEYMQRFKEMARVVRESQVPLELSRLEESILSVLNIPVNGIKQWVDSEMRKIQIIKQDFLNGNFS